MFIDLSIFFYADSIWQIQYIDPNVSVCVFMWKIDISQRECLRLLCVVHAIYITYPHPYSHFDNQILYVAAIDCLLTKRFE